MARGHTYGENMARWERENDERQWRYSLVNALHNRNFDYIKELVVEGINEDYDFPIIADPEVQAIIDSYRNN